MPDEPAKIGRPTDLTPEVADKVVMAVRSGAPLEVAAQSQGIAPMTFWGWMRRGEGRDPTRPALPVFAEFAQRVRAAEATAHMEFVIPIRKRAVNREDWQAAAAYLRMRWSKNYAERTEITGAEGGPLVVQLAQMVANLDDDAIADLLNRLGAKADPPAGADPEGEPPKV